MSVTALKIFLTIIQVLGNAAIVWGSIASTKGMGNFGAKSPKWAKKLQIYGVVSVSLSTFCLLLIS